MGGGKSDSNSLPEQKGICSLIQEARNMKCMYKGIICYPVGLPSQVLIVGGGTSAELTALGSMTGAIVCDSSWLSGGMAGPGPWLNCGSQASSARRSEVSGW